MSYAKVIYRDELESFLENFRDLVMNGKIEADNRKETLIFLEFFQKHLYESVLPVTIYDLRDTNFKSFKN